MLLCGFSICACGSIVNEITDQLTENTQLPAVDGSVSADTEEPEQPKPESLPVFLNKDGGNDANDGSTPEQAVATLQRAYALLEGNRDLIVLMSSLSEQNLPAYEGTVTFTSLHGGVDYNKTNGAVLRVSDLKLGGDTVFENIELFVGGASARICCNFNDLYIGDGVTVKPKSGRSIGIIGGYYVTDFALNGRAPMRASAVSHKGDCTVSVMSGTWSFIVGGNYRQGMNSPVGTFEGTLTVNIGGTAEVISQGRADDISADVVAAGGREHTQGSNKPQYIRRNV